MSPGATMERVYLELKARVMSGEVAPGSRFDPVVLAREFASSATPVRDALHRLSGERLIESWHHSGFRQPVPSETDLRELYTWCALLLGIALRSPGDPASVAPGDHQAGGSYGTRLVHLFRSIALLSENRELRQAIANAAERCGMLRQSEEAVDPEALPALAAMERDYDARRWAELRRGVARFHRRRSAVAAQVANRLRPPELQL